MCLRRRITIRCRHDGPDGPRPELKRYVKSKKMGSIDLSIKEKRSKYFIPLLIGAIWNIFFGSLGFFNLQFSNSLFFNLITPEAEIIANKTWWFVVIVAGIGYGIVAFANHKFRFFVTIGAIGKMAFFSSLSIYGWVQLPLILQLQLYWETSFGLFTFFSLFLVQGNTGIFKLTT